MDRKVIKSLNLPYKFGLDNNLKLKMLNTIKEIFLLEKNTYFFANNLLDWKVTRKTVKLCIDLVSKGNVQSRKFFEIVIISTKMKHL